MALLTNQVALICLLALLAVLAGLAAAGAAFERMGIQITNFDIASIMGLFLMVGGLWAIFNFTRFRKLLMFGLLLIIVFVVSRTPYQ